MMGHQVYTDELVHSLYLFCPSPSCVMVCCGLYRCLFAILHTPHRIIKFEINVHQESFNHNGSHEIKELIQSS